MSYVTEAYRGQLSTLHGQTLTAALMDPSFVGGPADGDLSTVTGEIVAPGYTRQTVQGVWEPGDGTLTWDAPPSFDADGAPEIQTALVADDTGQIVAGLTWSEPIAGVDGLELDAPYIASVADEAGVLGRLDDLDVRVAVLESAPPGGGGGGVVEVVAGANITVDDTDPTRPVVSASGGGGGGGGGDVSLSWKSWPSGPHMPTVAVVGDMPTGDDPPTTPAGLVSFVTPSVETALIDDGGPVQLGTVDIAHRPFESQVMASVSWIDQDSMTAGAALMVVQDSGEVLAMDLSGTLSDSDVVAVPLGAVQWLTLMGAH